QPRLRRLHSVPTRRSSDLAVAVAIHDTRNMTAGTFVLPLAHDFIVLEYLAETHHLARKKRFQAGLIRFQVPRQRGAPFAPDIIYIAGQRGMLSNLAGQLLQLVAITWIRA